MNLVDNRVEVSQVGCTPVLRATPTTILHCFNDVLVGILIRLGLGEDFDHPERIIMDKSGCELELLLEIEPGRGLLAQAICASKAVQHGCSPLAFAALI